jgi:membrane-associated phospholipid phosphatase
MDWLQHLDIEAFRFINRDLSNLVLDQVMPFFSGNALFHPALLLGGAILLWKGRLRGFLCLLMLALAVSLVDGFIARTLKEAIGRPRPFLTLEDVHVLVGKGRSCSMPSSHAANWFAAAMVMFLYYRRTALVILSLGLLVSFSRVYVGVHYPGDVLAGAILGAGAGAATICLVSALWRWIGGRFFPLWWEKFPSLVSPPPPRQPEGELEEEEPSFAPRGIKPGEAGPPRHASVDQHWLNLGYLLLLVLLVLRWIYLRSGTIQLSEDEAYQWLWSKHLDISYFSKPPLIAYAQWLGTSLWGDTEFGVRFLSPLISAVLGFLVLRFFAREVNARAGFVLLLIFTTAPMLSAGAVLMTVDPLSVLFWTAAMLAGWRAAQDNGTTRDWAWVGLWMALGFLSKYTQLFQLLCWAVFFVLWRPARKHLKRPGPYLALLINVLGATPVLIWNAQRHWITVKHVADDAGVGKPWNPTLRYFGEFIGAELGLLNPVFFVAMVWAAIAFWKRSRHNPKMVYLFSMGAPLFLAYTLHSFTSRVLPNWIVPALVPLFCLMVIYWDTRLRLSASRNVRSWLAVGLILGGIMVLLAHNTDLVRKITGSYLPVSLDPLRRARTWDTTAQTVNGVRQELLAEGKPVFIITEHYGIAGQLSFYLPEAREAVHTEPLVYYKTSPRPRNQFFFWKGYTHRTGENAIFVRELNRKKPVPRPPPPDVAAEFESITDLGVRNVLYHKMLMRPLQVFACRGLKPAPEGAK